MNLEAAAVYYGSEESYDHTASFPVCDIRSSSEINARMIGGRAYLWTQTRASGITAEELRILLKNGERLDSPILTAALGEPNVGIKQDDSTEYGYFYEIASENGEPRYAYFQTDSELGNILWALLCTPYEVDYKNPLIKN